jgi:hypothetical protein
LVLGSVSRSADAAALVRAGAVAGWRARMSDAVEMQQPAPDDAITIVEIEKAA